MHGRQSRHVFTREKLKIDFVMYKRSFCLVLFASKIFFKTYTLLTLRYVMWPANFLNNRFLKVYYFACCLLCQEEEKAGKRLPYPRQIPLFLWLLVSSA